MIASPPDEGFTHINISQKSNTALGLALSNASPHAFTYDDYGTFKCVESFIYYFLTGCRFHEFKSRGAAAARELAKTVRDYRIDQDGLTDEHKSVILGAIRCKLNAHQEIKNMLMTNTLPLSYYDYVGEAEDAAITILAHNQWVIDYYEKVSRHMKERLAEKLKLYRQKFPYKGEVVILITVRELNSETNRVEEIVSHGVNSTTGKTVILPTAPPQSLGAKFDPDEHGWYLDIHE